MFSTIKGSFSTCSGPNCEYGRYFIRAIQTEKSKGTRINNVGTITKIKQKLRTQIIYYSFISESCPSTADTILVLEKYKNSEKVTSNKSW